ncbi:MAG TPA: DUF11 domain-containing protein [Candidatus Peribacteraceae bacterium]|nr:DUF11 domain-containing protein [Candidatus Peribacteraceae bacterium]
MADTSRAKRILRQLPGHSFFTTKQSKIIAALAIAMLLISSVPSGMLGKVGVLSAQGLSPCQSIGGPTPQDYWNEAGAGLIQWSFNGGTATYTNNSNCDIVVRATSSEILGDNQQQQFDATDRIVVPRGSTHVFQVNIPSCDYQIDLEPYWSLQWYNGHSIVHGQVVSNGGLCGGGGGNSSVPTSGICQNIGGPDLQEYWNDALVHKTTWSFNGGNATFHNGTPCPVVIHADVYKIFTDNHQELYNQSQTVIVNPGQTQNFTMQIPNCDYQIDLQPYNSLQWYRDVNGDNQLHAVVHGQIVNNGGRCSTVSSASSSSSMSSSSLSSVSNNADLTISKTGASSFVRGNNITYTIYVHNNGPADAQNVTVVDSLAGNGLSFVSSPDTSCSMQGSSVVCGLGTVPSGQTHTVTLILAAPLSGVCTATNIVNVAAVTASNDANTSNNVSSPVYTTITCPAQSSSSSSISSSSSSSVSSISPNTDLSITKTGPSVLTPGQNATFTITVHNNGPVDGTNVQVVDVMGNRFNYVSSPDTSCSVQSSNNLLCNVGTVPAGQDRIVTLILNVQGGSDLCASARTFNMAAVTGNDVQTQNNITTFYSTLNCIASSSSISSIPGSSSVSSSSSISSQPPAPGCIQILKEAFNPAGQQLSPVPQFTFRLDNNQTVQSDANGNARFDNVSPGNHTVTEMIPQGWNQILVTPQNGQLFVPSGSFCAGIAFKNQQQQLPSSSSSSSSSVVSSSSSSISSLPMSSSSSSAPPLLGCINVQKQAYNNAGNPITPVPQFLFTLDGTQTAMNDANGNAFFGNVTPGQHTITESVPGGWAQIQSPGTITVQSGMSCANALFKNQQTVPPSSSSSSASSIIIPSSSSSSMSSQAPIVGCVSILKETFNTNGSPLNPVAPFQFRIDNGPVVTNDANGYARFDNVSPGMHTITEIPQQGWNQVLVTPQNGQLNVSAGSLCAGIVFKNQKSAPPQSSSSSSVCNSCTNGGTQNVIINSNSNTSVNSIINATGGNVITIDQNGNVTSNGANAQNAGVANNAGTNVNNDINAFSGNATNVTQSDNGANANAPLQLTPLFAMNAQAQTQPTSIPATNAAASNQQTQSLLSSILSMLNSLQQQLASMFVSH